MKRIISIILCISCVFVLLMPLSALAEEEEGAALPGEDVEAAETAEEPALEEDAAPAEEQETEETPAAEEAAPAEESAAEESGEAMEDTAAADNEAQPGEAEPAEEEIDEELTASASGEKEKLHIILIAGQSNAAVGSGKLDTPVTVPDVGNGFVWDNDYSEGSGGSDPLTDIAGYVYTRGTTDCVGKSIGFYPAIAAEWYALTGEKAVIIEAGYSGCSIDKWSTLGWTNLDLDHINNCFSYIENHCADKYEIVGAGFYWLQGESDSSIYPDSNGILCYKNPREYESYFLEIYNAYMSAFRAHGISSPYCGILTCRSWSNLGSNSVSEYCGVRAAQQYLANKYSDIHMASVLSDSWLRNGTATCSYSALSGAYSITSGKASTLFDTIHYCQTAYNIMGLEAADSIYRATRCGAGASSFVVYGHNAVTSYESGSTIYLEDNLRKFGENNLSEWCAAQLVIFPTPSCGNCGNIKLELTRVSDGTVVELESIMYEDGYIPDIYKLTEPMTLTVTLAGVTKSFTLARRSYSSAPVEEGFYANIPDANFARALKNQFGTGLDETKAAAITELNLSNYGIADLTGIEYFTALEKLDCSGNNLISLDLSANRQLVSLDCSENQLSELNIKGCEKLASLSAGGNKLSGVECDFQLESCDLGSQSAEGLTAYKTESGKYILDIAALVGSGNAEKIKLASTEGVTVLPGEASPELAICSALPECLSYTYTTAYGDEMLVSAVPELSEEPAVRAMQDYIILPSCKSQSIEVEAVSAAIKSNVSVSCAVASEEGNSGLVSVSGAEITANNKPGTAIIAVKAALGSEIIAEFEVRTDITEYDVTDPVTGVIGVTLAQNKVTTELYSTNYTELDILPQLMQLTVSGSDGYSYVPEDTGVAIEKAEFTDSAVGKYFSLIAYGDNTLRIVPTDAAVDNPSSVKSSYKSVIKVYFGDSEDTAFTTASLTLTVKKSLPKIKAGAVKINSWGEYKGSGSRLTFSGGNVTAVKANPAASHSNPDWLVLDEQSMSVNYSGLSRAKKSATLKLLCTVEGWERKPVAVSVSVSASPVAPSVSLSKTSVTIHSGTYDKALLYWTMKTPEYDDVSEYPVSVTYILDGSGYKEVSYNNNEVLTVDVDNRSRTITVSEAKNDGRSHSYRVFLYCAGKEFSFTVKTTVKTVGLKFKASGAINNLVSQCPVTITPTVSNLNGDYLKSGAVFSLESVTAVSGGKDYTSSFALSDYNGKNMTLTVKDGETVPKGSYTAKIALRYPQDAIAETTVKFSVKSSAVKISVSVKASGYIDVLRKSSYITIRPTWKNCYTCNAAASDIKLYTKSGKAYSDCTALFDISVSDGAYIVKAVSNLGTSKYYARLEASEAVSGYTAITVKQGKAAVKADPVSIYLFLKDKYDKNTISINLQDVSLNQITDVTLDASSAKYFDFSYTGDGQCEIGWKNNTPAKLKSGSSKTVKLSVYLEGGTKVAATVSVKVYIK